MKKADLSLIVRRTIPAKPQQVFEAWTNAKILQSWWGPKGVTCHFAEIDFKVGGKYQIGNTLADGSVILISGEFEQIVPNEKLIYSWSTDNIVAKPSKVTVKFLAVAGGTEVIVVHESISSQEQVDQHTYGWRGCLDRLEYLPF